MSYLSATKLSFAPKWADMNEDERLLEQVAAVEIVGKFGGAIVSQHILPTDGVLFVVTEYPDETAALKSQLAIQRRGAFLLSSQRAIPFEEFLTWQEEVIAVAGR